MDMAANDGIRLFLPETYDIVWSLIILVIVAAFFYKFFLPKFQSIFD
ncbi:MAG: F0F1 ATP synthase subunit B, partial [Bifidobacterium criceti]|nr:F0F1 ATP synthase subunit B [Bifidobacterium criceti]